MKHKPHLHPQEGQTQSQLRVEYLPLRSLQPAKRNPKKHQIDTVLASMSRFGYVSPMILDERTGRLVAGHGRLESLLKAKSEGREPPDRIRVQQGDWWVPVVRGIAFADDQQAEAFLLADNQTTIIGGWDERELKKIIDELGRDEALLGTGFEDLYHEEFDVEQDDPTPLIERELKTIIDELGRDQALLGTGFEELYHDGLDLEPDDATPLIDRAAELHKKWQTAHGQLWEIGTHRLLCGDSTSETDVRLLMNGQRACLFATDPPYLVDYNGTNHPHKWTKSHGHKHPGDKNWHDKYKDVDSPEKGEALYDAFVKVALEHAITQDAAWYCWHASRRQALLESVWDRYGAFVHQQIIWVKDRPILTRSWYMWQHEPCFFGWLKGKKPKRYAKDYPPSVWSFPTLRPGEPSVHPTEKPTELFAIPLRQHTTRGDICFEPFAGSGTQMVAAEKLGRVCYGMELSPPFVAVTLERLSLLGLQPRLCK